MVLDLMHSLPPEAQDDLLRVIEVAGASLPMEALFADLGGDPTSVVSDAASEQALRCAAFTTFAHLSRMVKSEKGVLDMMKVAEPFRSNWERTEQILREDCNGKWQHE